jgi:hypothetical protein
MYGSTGSEVAAYPTIMGNWRVGLLADFVADKGPQLRPLVCPTDARMRRNGPRATVPAPFSGPCVRGPVAGPGERC